MKKEVKNNLLVEISKILFHERFFFPESVELGSHEGDRVSCRVAEQSNNFLTVTKRTSLTPVANCQKVWGKNGL